MNGRFITGKEIERFRGYLTEEEKSDSTVEKYIRDVKAFSVFCTGKVTKETVIAYKQRLIDSGYAVSSINSMLAGINSMFSYLGWHEFRVKALKIQQRVFCPEDEELTKEEYRRLCRTAENSNNRRLSLILQTICCTGIRVSELRYITVEAVINAETTVSLKGKTRTVFIVRKLQKKLLQYIREKKIRKGPVFVTRTGKTVSRSNIWREMKKLCNDAGVSKDKVYPHNLRHLFARVFYSMEKDMARLADLLGHSSINTTRLYIVSTGKEHRKKMEKMNLIL